MPPATGTAGAAGVASGGYAIYPAALNASQSLFLEPWLNLFCLLEAVLLFDGDRIAGRGEPGGPDRHPRRALIALSSSYLGAGNVPRGGLYIRKS